MRKSLALWATLISGSLSGPSLASPWPQDEGHGLSITSFSFLGAPNEAGTINPASGKGEFRDQEINNYTEYGLTHNLTIGSDISGELRQLNSSSTIGIGDIQLFARDTIWQNDSWAVAGQGLVKLPTGYNPNSNPALGNGQTDYEPKIIVGHGFSFGPFPAFADVGAGYRIRTGLPNNQSKLDAEIGVHVQPDWMVLVQSFNIMSHNEEPGTTNFTLSTLRVSMVHDISPKWSFGVGLFAEVATYNYNPGNGGFASIWWKF